MVLSLPGFFIVIYATLKGINEVHTDSYHPTWKQVPCFTVGVFLKYEAMDARLMSDIYLIGYTWIFS